MDHGCVHCDGQGESYLLLVGDAHEFKIVWNK
jgi:hypothetical protein